jgi:hypothetical protein
MKIRVVMLPAPAPRAADSRPARLRPRPGPRPSHRHVEHGKEFAGRQFAQRFGIGARGLEQRRGRRQAVRHRHGIVRHEHAACQADVRQITAHGQAQRIDLRRRARQGQLFLGRNGRGNDKGKIGFGRQGGFPDIRKGA